MNKYQKAINRYTKQTMKYIEGIYGHPEPFRITRIWNKQDLKEIYGKSPRVEILNRLVALSKEI